MHSREYTSLRIVVHTSNPRRNTSLRVGQLSHTRRDTSLRIVAAGLTHGRIPLCASLQHRLTHGGIPLCAAWPACTWWETSLRSMAGMYTLRDTTLRSMAGIHTEGYLSAQSSPLPHRDTLSAQSSSLPHAGRRLCAEVHPAVHTEGDYAQRCILLCTEGGYSAQSGAPCCAWKDTLRRVVHPHEQFLTKSD